MTFQVIAEAPTYMTATVTVLANSREEAEKMIIQMYNDDLIDFGPLKTDFDKAEICSITEIQPDDQD
jgi:hypothetical protein